MTVKITAAFLRELKRDGLITGVRPMTARAPRLAPVSPHAAECGCPDCNPDDDDRDYCHCCLHDPCCCDYVVNQGAGDRPTDGIERRAQPQVRDVNLAFTGVK